MVNIERMNDILLFELLAYGTDEFKLIFKNMLFEDFFILQDKWYDVLIKIIYDKELAGFIVGNYNNNDMLVLELGYLLPTYRDKGIFIKVLLMFEENICLYMPNRFMINSLIMNGCAEKINDKIVKSKFLLSFHDDNDDLVCSYYYHLQKCGVIKDRLISPLQIVDIECFKADFYR